VKDGSKLLLINRLKDEVTGRTEAVESALGNLDLNLLYSTLKERDELLKKLVLLNDGDGMLLDFLREILARDAVIRARLAIQAGRTKESMKSLEMGLEAEKKYAAGAWNAVDGGGYTRYPEYGSKAR